MANFKITAPIPSEEDVDQTFSIEEYINQITDTQVEIIKNKGYFSPNMCFCNNCYHTTIFIEEIDPLIINNNMVVICKNCGKYIPIKPHDYSVLALKNNIFPPHISISEEISKESVKTWIKNFFEGQEDNINLPAFKILSGFSNDQPIYILDPRIEYDAFGQRKIGIYIPTYEEYLNLEKEKGDKERERFT